MNQRLEVEMIEVIYNVYIFFRKKIKINLIETIRDVN